MKKALAIVLLVVLILCNACTQKDDENALFEKSSQPAKSDLPEVPVVSPASPNPTSGALVLPDPVQAKPDADIPDIIIDNIQKANSNEWFYEDEKYMCFSVFARGLSNLYVIEKSNKNIRIVLDQCDLFTAENGNIYYTTQDKNEIIRFDIKKKTKQTIVSTDDEIWSLASIGNNIYFSCQLLDSNMERTSLYVCEINGNNLIKIGRNVDSFCIYNDEIFGITYGEMGDLVKYHLNQSQEVVVNRPVYYQFDISLGRIVLAEFHNSENNFSNNLVYDIETGDLYELAPISPFYTVAGQYMLFVETDENDGTVLLKAYNYIDNIEYTLYDISNLSDDNNIGASIQFSNENLYLRIRDSDKISFYKVTIQNGQTLIEHYLSVDIEEAD